jgi:hypothetical protein
MSNEAPRIVVERLSEILNQAIHGKEGSDNESND